MQLSIQVAAAASTLSPAAKSVAGEAAPATDRVETPFSVCFHQQDVIGTPADVSPRQTAAVTPPPASPGGGQLVPGPLTAGLLAAADVSLAGTAAPSVSVAGAATSPAPLPAAQTVAAVPPLAASPKPAPAELPTQAAPAITPALGQNAPEQTEAPFAGTGAAGDGANSQHVSDSQYGSSSQLAGLVGRRHAKLEGKKATAGNAAPGDALPSASTGLTRGNELPASLLSTTESVAKPWAASTQAANSASMQSRGADSTGFVSGEVSRPSSARKSGLAHTGASPFWRIPVENPLKPTDVGGVTDRPATSGPGDPTLLASAAGYMDPSEPARRLVGQDSSPLSGDMGVGGTTLIAGGQTLVPAAHFAPSLLSHSELAGPGLSTPSRADPTGAPGAPIADVSPGSRRLEIGFLDSTLGWLSVRAEAAQKGAMHLTIGSTATNAGEGIGAAVHDLLPGLKHYLEQHGIPAESLTAVDRAREAVHSLQSAAAALADGALNDASLVASPGRLVTSHSSATAGMDAGTSRGYTQHNGDTSREQKKAAAERVSVRSEALADAGATSPATHLRNSGSGTFRAGIATTTQDRMLSVRI